METGIKLYLDAKEVRTGSRELVVNEEYMEHFGIQAQSPGRIETHLHVRNTWSDLGDGHVTGTVFGAPFTAHVVSKEYVNGVVGLTLGGRQSALVKQQMDFTLLVVFGVNTCTQHK